MILLPTVTLYLKCLILGLFLIPLLPAIGLIWLAWWLSPEEDRQPTRREETTRSPAPQCPARAEPRRPAACRSS